MAVANHHPSLPAPVDGLIGLHRAADPAHEQDGLTRLERNERVSPFPDWFMREIRHAITSDLLTNYPITEELHEALAAQCGLDKRQVLLTPGSDAAFKALYQAYVRPGDQVVVLDPSYAMFEVYGRMFQAELIKVGYGHQLRLDTAKLVDSVSAGVRMVLLANPNQPTGTLVQSDVIAELARRAQCAKALVVIDEAYYPFSSMTVMPMISQFPNLMVVRTFSKAAGLAGLRVGYVAGHHEVVGNLFKVRAANDIASLAVLFALKTMQHPEVVNRYLQQTRAGAAVLSARVRAMGLEPLPSAANFILIRLHGRAQPQAVVAGLRKMGFAIKGPFTHPELADCIRITLAPPAIMHNVANALEKLLSELRAGARGPEIFTGGRLAGAD